MTTLADYLSELRTSLEDPGDTITDQFTGDGTTTRWKASSFPIKTVSDTVTVGGASYTNYTVNYNNGEFLFGTAPGAAIAVQLQYTKVVWPDERLTSALNAGIRQMYKDGAYKIGECYIQCQTQKYDYDLASIVDVPPVTSFGDQTLPSTYNPVTARADLQKAQTRIHVAEYHPFGPNQPYTPFYAFGRTTPRGLHIDGDPTPNDTLRLLYTGPFTVLVATTDVTDVPDELYMAPVWYALSVLMDKKEAKRVRSDGYNVMQNANAVPPGQQAQTAEDFLARYHELMDGGMRPLKMSQRKRIQSWQYSEVIR
jgi:hypothetical protein